jgi:hypothetical protein
LRFLWPFGRKHDDDEQDLPLVAGYARARRATPSTAGRLRPDFPGFRASALDRPVERKRGERREITRARFAMMNVFTPTQPVTNRASFAGPPRHAEPADLGDRDPAQPCRALWRARHRQDLACSTC